MTTTGDEIKNEKLSVAEELVKLNKLFAKRYTDEDEEYIQMAKPRSKSPPIVNDWGQDKNNYRNQRRHYSNDRYNNNNNNRYDYQQNRNQSRDNHYRQDHSRSSPYYHDKRQ